MLSKSGLILKLCQHFENEGITYVIVGDTRRFPNEIHGDIDIFIDTCFLSLAKRCLREFCGEHGIKIAQVLQHEQSAWYYIMVWFNEIGEIITINPDICSDYFRYGRLLLKAEEVLTDCVRVGIDGGTSKGFFIPSPARGFIYYLIKKIDKGALDERHGEYLSSQWKLDVQGAMDQINRFWKQPEAGLLAKAAAHNNWKPIHIKIGIFKDALRTCLGFSFKHLWFESMRRMRRVIRPTGIFVVFLGSDGSGKSTIIAHVQKDLAPLFRRTQIYHLRPHFGRPAEDQGAIPEPHGQPPRNCFASILKVFFYWADYTTGYWLSICPSRVRSTLILFDRYFYDLMIDPKRLRYGGPKWFPNLCVKYIPTPDLIIYLDASPKVLICRKQEVSHSELERQQQEYSGLIANLRNGYKVDASNPLAEVVGSVERIIVEFLEARVRKRLTFDV